MVDAIPDVPENPGCGVVAQTAGKTMAYNGCCGRRSELSRSAADRWTTPIAAVFDGRCRSFRRITCAKRRSCSSLVSVSQLPTARPYRDAGPRVCHPPFTRRSSARRRRPRGEKRPAPQSSLPSPQEAQYRGSADDLHVLRADDEQTLRQSRDTMTTPRAKLSAAAARAVRACTSRSGRCPGTARTSNREGMHAHASSSAAIA
jgi:hypothetical protein